MALTLTSPTLDEGGTIPTVYTCDGKDLSPPLQWSGAPEGTRSFLLICDDPDAPGGTYRHWAVYDIPPDWTGLDEGAGAPTPDMPFKQAVNDFDEHGYVSPCPPPGSAPHGYHFRLSALSTARLSAPPTATCVEIAALAGPHEIEAAELVVHYAR